MQLNRFSKLLSGTALALILSSCAHTAQPGPKSQIQAFRGRAATHPTNRIRLQAIKETAQAVGAQAGLAWAADFYNRLLRQQKKTLDNAYNFQPLMLNNDVVPPVLEESRNTLNLSSSSTIRLSDRDYKIIKPAKFVTVVPSWRNYLWMNFQKPEAPDSSLLPKTNQERDYWNKNIAIGWNNGVKQAQQIFTININRLTRDYQGMILYHKLLAQNIVSPPYVAKSNLGITGGDDNLRINDRVLRITSMAKFRANSKLWKSRIHAKYPLLPPKRLPKRGKRKSNVIRAYG